MISAVQLTNLRSQCGAPWNQASPRARRPRRIATILTLHQACPANRKEAGSLVRRQTVRTRAGWRSNPDEALVVTNRPVVFAGTCSMVGMPVSLPFTEADIRLAAGDRSFERGLEYLDAVEDLEISDTEVTPRLIAIPPMP
jgi:hypothetical protein